MNAVEIIAKRRIEEAIEDGLFARLPRVGEIDCRLRGEAFMRKWLTEKLERESEAE